MLVRGTIGIGKSALCRELVQRAAASGWRVLSTVSTASGAPYGPIAAAVEQLLVGDRAAFDALPERTRSVLAELTPLAGPEDSEYVDFSPAAEFQHVLDHLTGASTHS